MTVRDEHEQPDDRQRWRSFVESTPAAATACPDALVLAAWLDDRLHDAERDAVDRHLAACTACTEAVLDVRAMLDDDAAPDALMSPTLLAAARDLVPLPAKGERIQRWRGDARGGLVAASLLLVVAGYRAGFTAAPAPSATPAAWSDATLDEPASEDALWWLALQEVTP